jgi:hypothetical protein
MVVVAAGHYFVAAGALPGLQRFIAARAAHLPRFLNGKLSAGHGSKLSAGCWPWFDQILAYPWRRQSGGFVGPE